MHLDPRTRFQKSPHGKTWADAIATEWFQEGLEASIASMALSGNDTPDDQRAAGAFYRMEGARKLIQTMMNLCEARPEREAPSMPANLKSTK